MRKHHFLTIRARRGILSLSWPTFQVLTRLPKFISYIPTALFSKGILVPITLILHLLFSLPRMPFYTSSIGLYSSFKIRCSTVTASKKPLWLTHVCIFSNSLCLQPPQNFLTILQSTVLFISSAKHRQPVFWLVKCLKRTAFCIRTVAGTGDFNGFKNHDFISTLSL